VITRRALSSAAARNRVPAFAAARCSGQPGAGAVNSSARRK